MQIQFNSDRHIDGHAELVERAEEIVRRVLGRFDDRVTRVEIHVSDVDAGKNAGEDKRCMMEARVERRPPIAVSDAADHVEVAINGAAQKLKRALTADVEKRRGR